MWITDNSEGDGKRRDKTESTNGDCHQEIKVTGSRCFDIFNSIKRIILFKMGCCGCGDDDTAKIEPGVKNIYYSYFNLIIYLN